MQITQNLVILTGRLGNDPEIIEYATDKKLAIFSLATNESPKNPVWHKIVVRNNELIELTQSKLKKGLSVHIKGRLVYNYMPLQNGKKIAQAEIQLAGADDSEIIIIENNNVDLLEKEENIFFV